MFNVYSIPAIIALVAKGAILYFAYGAKIQNFKTRLFTVAVTLSVGLSIVEAVGLVYALHSEYEDQFGYAYFAFFIPLLATLTHLAILITFDKPHHYTVFFIYGYVALLEFLLLFTPLLITGFEPFKGYTIMRVDGPLYGLVEALVICSALTMVFLPFLGLRKERPVQTRNQCKLWIAAATPLALLSIASALLAHFKIRLFNNSVTLPLLFTLLLAAVGYAVHNRRLIELDFYIPWSRTRKEKKRFYEHLSRLYLELSQSSTPQEVLDRLSEILKCPAVLISRVSTILIRAGLSQPMESFPKQDLCGADKMLVINEIEEVHPYLHALMKSHQVAVIVPFYPQSKHMATWLLLGEDFSKRVYTPLDFRVVEQLFDKLGHLLLDDLAAKTGQSQVGNQAIKSHQGELQEQIKANLDALLEKFRRQGAVSLDKTLDEHLSEVEALLLKHAIESSGGNRAKAARFLGVRPNTLHYKLERYGLLHSKK